MKVKVIDPVKHLTFQDLKVGQAFRMHPQQSESDSTFLKISDYQGFCLERRGGVVGEGSNSKFTAHCLVIPAVSVEITVTY